MKLSGRVHSCECDTDDGENFFTHRLILDCRSGNRDWSEFSFSSAWSFPVGAEVVVTVRLKAGEGTGGKEDR